MTPSENTFLEHAAVQILFVSGRESPIEGLREKLCEMFVQGNGRHDACGIERR